MTIRDYVYAAIGVVIVFATFFATLYIAAALKAIITGEPVVW